MIERDPGLSIVASAALFSRRNGQLLMWLFRRDCEKDAGRPIDRMFELAGGSVENETAAQAVCREVREELKIRGELLSDEPLGRFDMGPPASMSAATAGTTRLEQWPFAMLLTDGCPTPQPGIHSEALALPPRTVYNWTFTSRGLFCPGQIPAIRASALFGVHYDNAQQAVQRARGNGRDARLPVQLLSGFRANPASLSRRAS